MRISLITTLFSVLFASAVGANENTVDYLHALNSPKLHVIEMAEQGRDIGLYVRLPKLYNEVQKYPTIYLLDGGVTFPLLAAYTQYLSSAGDVPPIILVGVAYPGDDFEKGNNRGTDYTAPSSERGYYGGGEAFLNMFKTQAFPLIESTYSSDPDKRIIFGQSLGGQLSLLAALTKPDLFYGHIASNPALHRNLDFFLRLKNNEGAKQRQPKLFVSLAENDEERFAVPARKWVQHMKSNENQSFDFKLSVQDGHNHFSPAPAAFRQGVMWLLPKG